MSGLLVKDQHTNDNLGNKIISLMGKASDFISIFHKGKTTQGKKVTWRAMCGFYIIILGKQFPKYVFFSIPFISPIPSLSQEFLDTV